MPVTAVAFGEPRRGGVVDQFGGEEVPDVGGPHGDRLPGGVERERQTPTSPPTWK